MREAIEQRDWPLATTQIALAADTLALFDAQVDRATGILTGSRRRSRRSPPAFAKASAGRPASPAS